jgi:hypothetical protein
MIPIHLKEGDPSQLWLTSSIKLVRADMVARFTILGERFLIFTIK